jgi:lysozyme
MVAELIDVSNFQADAPIDWAKVAGAGIAGVYAKATDGAGSPDASFSAHAANARAAGIRVGAYHYLHVRAGAPQDAIVQADEFCARYTAASCTLRPALDVEPDDNPAAATQGEWLDAIRIFRLRTRVNLGFYPLTYSYPSFWNSKPLFALAPDLLDGGLWGASYGVPVPTLLKPFTDVDLWQYSDAGVVAGLPEKVDRSRAPGAIDALVVR